MHKDMLFVDVLKMFVKVVPLPPGADTTFNHSQLKVPGSTTFNKKAGDFLEELLGELVDSGELPLALGPGLLLLTSHHNPLFTSLAEPVRFLPAPVFFCRLRLYKKNH